jgi:hypothetical protein
MLHFQRNRLAPSVWVAGQDMDWGIIAGLARDDLVLVELDGKRVLSDLEIPLISEFAWKVSSNIAGDAICLYYGRKKLSLSYKNIINREPVVFEEVVKWYNNNSVKVVLQLPSFRSTISEEKGLLPVFDMNSIDYVLADNEAREALIARLWLTVRRLSADGYEHGSVNRLALLSGLQTDIIHKFREKCEITDSHLKLIVGAMAWFRHYLKVNGQDVATYAV